MSNNTVENQGANMVAEDDSTPKQEIQEREVNQNRESSLQDRMSGLLGFYSDDEMKPKEEDGKEDDNL